MNNTGASILEIVLWIVLITAILVATAYGLFRWLRKKAEETLAQVAGQVQQFAGRAGEIHTFLQQYEQMGYEPYLTPVQKLIQDLHEVEDRLQQIDGAGHALQEEFTSPGTNRMRTIINSPFNWYRRSRQAQELAAQSAEAAEHLTAAEGQVQAIRELPWNVALQAHQSFDQVDEMARLAQDLKQRGAQGAGLNSVLARIPVLQRSLGDIPLSFRRAEKPDLLQTATQDDTVQVYEILVSMRSVLERWLPMLREWDLSYQKAAGELENAHQAIGNLRQSLLQPPAGLHTAPIQQRAEQVMAMLADLEKQLEKPEVEQMKTIQRQSTRLRKLVEDAGLQLHKAGQRAAELSRVLEDLKSKLQTLTNQMDAVEKKEAQFIWDESRPALEATRRQVLRLGTTQQSRTPEQVEAALNETRAINEQIQSLNQKVELISEQYEALIALLHSPELQDGPGWVRNTREMIAQAEVYDPHNWSTPDVLSTLKSSVDVLDELQDRLSPGGQPQPVKESGLDERLKETRQLSDLYKAARPRADAIRTRLEKIQALEEEGKEKLAGAWGVLEKTSILAESNDLLNQTASEDLKRLSDELKRQANDLNQQNQGVIEKKIQQIQAQTSSVYQAYQSWLSQLSAANTALAKQISDRLLELDAITVLDDPPFEDARGLLARDDLRQAPASLRGVIGQKLSPRDHPSHPSEQEASAEIKRKNDLWQTLLSAWQAVEEKSAPIMQAYQEAAEARKEAQDLAAEMNNRFSQRRTWPPFSQTPLPAEQGIAPVDSRWEAMRKQHVHSDWAILELGRLAGQYRATAERINQLLDRIRQDQERVYEQEDQIEALKERWIYQSQEMPENPLFYHGVQQLLSKTDAQLAFLRQQYMRGSLSYEEVQQSLHLLYDDLNTARVPVDENHDEGLANQRPRADRNGRA